VSAVTALPTPLSLDPKAPYLRSQEGGDTSLNLLAPSERAPDIDEGEIEPVPNAVPDQQAQPRKLHLLIVDDNKVDRHLLATFARRCKLTYVEAENGQDAVSHFSATLQQTQTIAAINIPLLVNAPSLTSSS
jgi:hypothetical protein